MYLFRQASFGAVFLATIVCYIHLGIQQAATYPQSGTVQRYFSTPQHSVNVIAKLTRAQDWETLESFQFAPMDNSALSALFESPVGYKEAVIPPEGDIDVVLSVRNDEGALSPEPAGHYRLRAFPEGYQLVPNGPFFQRVTVQALRRREHLSETPSPSAAETAPGQEATN